MGTLLQLLFTMLGFPGVGAALKAAADSIPGGVASVVVSLVVVLVMAKLVRDRLTNAEDEYYSKNVDK